MHPVYWTVVSVSASVIGLACISGICYCYVYILLRNTATEKAASSCWLAFIEPSLSPMTYYRLVVFYKCKYHYRLVVFYKCNYHFGYSFN